MNYVSQKGFIDKKYLLIGGGVAVALAVALYFLFAPNLKDQIVIPYISHQKPIMDPHIPSHIPISDKLDEMLYDGLFNISANPSGITYEDGLGELVGIDADNMVTVRLKPTVKWHQSFKVLLHKEDIEITPTEAVYFIANDLRFTLKRIQRLGSLSPDYVLVGQAVENFDFMGPDDNNEIRFKFKGDRIWNENDIKEVLSFKIIPHTATYNQLNYTNGTGPYMYAGEYKDAIYFPKNPAGAANISRVVLKPFIDNSTFTSELSGGNINCLLSTPFGALSPILQDSTDFFYKSNISNTFFAVFFNTQRLNKEQRKALKALINNKAIINRFYKVGTKQQRHITDFQGNFDNYDDYLNYSVFPSSSYYVQEKIVQPSKTPPGTETHALSDTVKIVTCLNFGFREELAELIRILNDPAVTGGKIKALAVSNEQIKRGNYDAVLVPVTNYRSNFMFDLYEIFLREPDFSTHKIHLITDSDGFGQRSINLRSFQADKNFFRLDAVNAAEDREAIARLLQNIYTFMSTREIGDKQAFARFIDEQEQELALGSWLFSLPSLAYFSAQFDPESIDIYGVASQLSTIEKWREAKKK
ncbi:ABC transporter substrate-binding protein [Calditrichota bacterium LG25]